MKLLTAAAPLVLTTLTVFPQDNAQKIYDTERAFERTVAEKGINAGFIEFMAPLGVIFTPRPENAREVWTKRDPSPAALTWNPIKIEVSSNGALAYSIGNSIYRPKGASDATIYYGHYLSVWGRQGNGEYRALLDTGIDHPTPAANEPAWTTTPQSPVEANPKNKFAGDSSISFYQMAEERGFGKAYKAYGAEDMYLMRDGVLPVIGNDAAAKFIEGRKLAVRFTKRKSFVEAGDLAYVYSGYVLLNKDSVEQERGSFVQVWKLHRGRWVIAADVFIPIPPEKS